MDKTKIIAGFLGDSVREQASQKITELVTKRDIYQALVYAEATGARPALTQEQYSGLENEFKTQEHRFPRYKMNTFTKLITAWKPQGGNE
jgi:hypothetical protein